MYKFFNIFKFSLLSVIVIGGVTVFAEWYNPSLFPPDGNPPEPVNTSLSNQIKEGDLTVKKLITTGFSLTTGASKNSVLTSSDESGNAVWRVPGASGDTLWSLSGTNDINNTDLTGRVGIGTPTPGAKLDVNGSILFGGGKGGLSYYKTPGYDQIELGTPSGSSSDVSFHTNGVSRMWIKPSGNVGIGTPTPGAPLEIKTDSTISSPLLFRKTGGGWNFLEFFSNTTRTAWMGMRTDQKFSINDQINLNTNTGNVGIGTTGPVAKLTVDGTGLVGGANQSAYDIGAGRIAAGNAIYSYRAICAGNNTGDCSSNKGVTISAGATVGTPTVAISGSGNSYFNTAGRVGIGITEPVGTLHINGSVAGGKTQSLVLGNDGTTNNSGTALYMGFQASGLGLYGARILQTGFPSSTRSTDLSFQIHGTPADNLDSSWNTALFIQRGTGNVGIGTTTPEFKLSLDTDGGILAKGTYGSGATLPTAGPGTRLIWYPRKAAFRAGSVDGTQWNDGSIGAYSTAMGYGTTASGDFSTAMGSNTTARGNSSTAMGGSTTSSGYSSTAMGSNTTSSGYFSTAMGYGTTASGDYSTAMGSNTTARGNSSTAMGYGTTASGYFSTAMGYGTTASGEYSTAMGHNVNTNSLNSFGINVRQSFATKIVSDPYSFNVFYGANGSERKFSLQSDGNMTINPGGDCCAIWSSQTYNSSIRWKENIRPLDNALDKVLKLRGVYFDWKPGKTNAWNETKKDIGFIAEEVGKIFPEMVSYENNDGINAQSLDYARLTSVLVEAVKEQQKQIGEQQGKISNLESRLNKIEELLGGD